MQLKDLDPKACADREYNRGRPNKGNLLLRNFLSTYLSHYWLKTPEREYYSELMLFHAVYFVSRKIITRAAVSWTREGCRA
jgi:hypothetical protein